MKICASNFSSYQNQIMNSLACKDQLCEQSDFTRVHRPIRRLHTSAGRKPQVSFTTNTEYLEETFTLSGT